MNDNNISRLLLPLNITERVEHIASDEVDTTSDGTPCPILFPATITTADFKLTYRYNSARPPTISSSYDLNLSTLTTFTYPSVIPSFVNYYHDNQSSSKVSVPSIYSTTEASDKMMTEVPTAAFNLSTSPFNNISNTTTPKSIPTYQSINQSTTPTRIPSYLSTNQSSTIIPTNSPSFPLTNQSSTVTPTSSPSFPTTNQSSTVTPTSSPSFPTTYQSSTVTPTSIPTYSSTYIPSTAIPTTIPTNFITQHPSSIIPSICPSYSPTYIPSSRAPTIRPSSISPTMRPTFAPFIKATLKPTPNPTSRPTSSSPSNPTIKPTSLPTLFPSYTPTYFPTLVPTCKPSYQPSSQPSSLPTLTPTISKSPTTTPSRPTCIPSTVPSFVPTRQNSPLLLFFINLTISNITKTILSTTSELVISDSIAETMDIQSDYVKYRYISNIQPMNNNNLYLNIKHVSTQKIFSLAYTASPHIIQVTSRVSLLLSSSPQYDATEELYNHLIQKFQINFNDGIFTSIFIHKINEMNAYELNYTNVISFSISPLIIIYPVTTDTHSLSAGDIIGIIISIIAIIILSMTCYTYFQTTYYSKKRDIRVYLSHAEEEKDLEIIMNS